MQELTDDQLDGLFRKSAEEFDPPFDPAAWQDMQARLDADGPTPAGRSAVWKNIMRWGIPVLLLLLGSAGYIYYAGKETTPSGRNHPQLQSGRIAQSDKGPGNVTGRPNLEHSPAEKSQLVTKSDELNSIDSEPDVAKKQSERPSAAQPVIARKPADDATERPVLAYGSTEERRPRAESTIGNRSNRTVRKERTHVTHGRKPLNVSRSVSARPSGVYTELGASPSFSSPAYARSSGKPFSKRYEKGARTQPVAGGAFANATESTVTVQTEADNRLLLPNLDKLASRPVNWPGPALMAARTVQMPDGVSEGQRPQSVVPRGLSARLLVSPDLSAVGLRNFSRPGTNVGLLLEYRFGQRWSLQAGVLKSTKIYRAATSEYSFPYNWAVRPEGIDGRCSMLDIPINVRYDFAIRPRVDRRWQPNRWFVSGGLTSYYMEKETYTFVYADPSDPHIYPRNRGWSGSTGGYGFSQLNLSAGYEHAFGQRLAWQVEPFLKAPLKGIGNYKINLLSTGVFFSVRYKF